MKMIQKIFSRALWLGRGTATVMGLAMLLALTVGLASTALAGTGVGARLDLGKVNTVNAMSSLVGSVAGPSLKIDNNSTASGATALDLQVEQGKPPMRVNSTTEVQGLNVDSIDGKNSSDFLGEHEKADDANLLDGKDSAAFVPARIYTVADVRRGGGGGDVAIRNPGCDKGDLALSGGGGSDDSEDVMVTSQRFETATTQGWLVLMRDEFGASFIRGEAHCADLPPIRP